MAIEDTAKEATSYLPTRSAKLALFGSVVISGSVYWLLQYIQAETLIPLKQAQKFTLLFVAGIPLLLGAYLTLFFVVRAYNNKEVSVRIREFKDENS